MRAVLIGSVGFSRSALAKLLTLDVEIVGVCTLRESPGNADHVDLSALCEEHGVPWTYSPRINAEESVAWIRARRPDILFCLGWSRLLGPELLSLAPGGVVGFHPAALPANRGRHPLIWAIVLGLRETGSTFFRMDAGADSGDILSQEIVPIAAEETAATLYAKITACALSQLERLVPQLASGTVRPVRQDDRRANSWRKRGRADGQIDWRMSAASIDRLVRALARPYVGAHFVYQGQDVKVWRAERIDHEPANIEPGRIVSVDGAPVVRCGDGAIRLVDTEPSFAPVMGEYL